MSGKTIASWTYKASLYNMTVDTTKTKQECCRQSIYHVRNNQSSGQPVLIVILAVDVYKLPLAFNKLVQTGWLCRLTEVPRVIECVSLIARCPSVLFKCCHHYNKSIIKFKMSCSSRQKYGLRNTRQILIEYAVKHNLPGHSNTTGCCHSASSFRVIYH